MLSLFLKLVATVLAIIFHIIANAAAMETYYFLFLSQKVRYSPDGLFLITLMIPAMIAIWSKGVTIGYRLAAWLFGLFCLVGAVLVSRIVVAGAMYAGSPGGWTILLAAMPLLIGVLAGWAATNLTLRSARQH